MLYGSLFKISFNNIQLITHQTYIITLQMLRKSVETRDWLNTIEPRTVRAVMKRVVEDITTMDVQVIAHHSLQIIP